MCTHMHVPTFLCMYTALACEHARGWDHAMLEAHPNLETVRTVHVRAITTAVYRSPQESAQHGILAVR